MTLTLNQSDLYRFDRLIAKLIKPSAEAKVCFIPDSTGLKLTAFANNSILTMTLEKQGFVDPFSISTATLKTLAVKKDTDIELTPQKDSIHVKCGEEQKWVPREKQVNTLPGVPKTTATNGKAILTAVRVRTVTSRLKPIIRYCRMRNNFYNVSMTHTNSLGRALIPNWIIIALVMPVLLARNLHKNSVRNTAMSLHQAPILQVQSNSNSLPLLPRRTNSTGGR